MDNIDFGKLFLPLRRPGGKDNNKNPNSRSKSYPSEDRYAVRKKNSGKKSSLCHLMNICDSQPSPTEGSVVYKVPPPPFPPPQDDQLTSNTKRDKIRRGEKNAAQIQAIVSKTPKDQDFGEDIEAKLQKAIDRLLDRKKKDVKNGQQKSRVPKMFLGEGPFAPPELDMGGWLPPFKRSSEVGDDGLHNGWSPLGESEGLL